MPLSLTPLQQQNFVQNTVYNVLVGVGAAHMELNHLGLGMPTPEAQHETFVGRDGAFRHETARVAHEELYLAQSLLGQTLTSLPLADRAPGREAITSLQLATRKLNNFLSTANVEKQLPHGVAAYAAIKDAESAVERLSKLVSA